MIVFVVVGGLLLAAAPGAAGATSWPDVRVTSVNGLDVSGGETPRLRGTELEIAGTAAIRPPLTADPGPTVFALHGQDLVLDGRFSGGVAPYAVEWTGAPEAAFSSPSTPRTVLSTR